MQVLWALSLSHLLNDTVQALLPSIYPLLKDSFQLNFTQVGLITLAYQATASLLQPVVGSFTDRRPQPFSLAIGMTVTLVGLVLLAYAPNYGVLLVGSAVIGLGSAIFHPEASRVARLASGGRHGFAQALFQVGGNFGTSLGPLAAAAIIVPHGRASLMWFSVIALLGMHILYRVGCWYQSHLAERRAQMAATQAERAPRLPRAQVIRTIGLLLVLIFSKYVYLVCLTNYYTFYLIHKFAVSVQSAQVYLFLFLFAVAAGTIIGGPLGDRFGRKYVIWFSILGTAPFAIALPYAGLAGTVVLSLAIGVILASAFSAILVYAQELVPGRVGLIAGLFFGFAFGISGIASTALGALADHTSIDYVFHVCGYLPLIGLIAGFLPRLDGPRHRAKSN